MIILRLFFVLVALLLVLSGGMYIFTGNRRHLIFIWKVLRFSVVLLLVLIVLFVLERYILSAWRILL